MSDAALNTCGVSKNMMTHKKYVERHKAVKYYQYYKIQKLYLSPI